MVSELIDGANLFGQIVCTGFWAFLLVGGMFAAKRHFGLEGNWPYWVAGGFALFLLVVPNGWRVVFGTDPRDFALLLEARQMIPATALFKADFWGVLIGSIAGLIGSRFVPERWHW
ncbi:hypothetical protein [Pseudomonas koreensis]|uniref:hypothetical protein n=1 Tax=Pseudomonas koreensis TaxID=198620 RepID=UPI0009F4ED40|nr:hypothetical protein [Pseudomonas koreensis]KAB0510869.1 hypothetical protein F7R05_21950 [Pseudomonas koreensis]NNA64384.1 hypothetical protein [Pseudomonas koreensis]GGK53151.1 hypothetical protein GCM10009103_54350 [Pseudomonas koreensis]